MVEPVVTVTTRVVAVVSVALLLGVSGGVPAAATGQKGKAKVYEPPYRNGPAGGDRFNHAERDRETGRMMVGRLFPGFPPVVGCVPEPSAGWAMFRVKHKVTRPVSKVTLDYQAALDPYAWVTVGARDDDGDWLGVRKYQGPAGGSGTLTAKLFDRPRPGDTIFLEFGLQLGDACPQASFAAAEFPSVKVR